MKCVKLLNKSIVRVSDEEAAKLVATGRGVYVGKQEWKADKSNSSFAYSLDRDMDEIVEKVSPKPLKGKRAGTESKKVKRANLKNDDGE